MRLLQGWVQLPRTFATLHSKDQLSPTDALLRSLKEKVLSTEAGLVPRVAYFLSTMISEHEQKATISDDGATLHTNGTDFEPGMVIKMKR